MQGNPASGGYGAAPGSGQYPPQQPQQYPPAPGQQPQHYSSGPQSYAGGSQDHGGAGSYSSTGAGAPSAGYPGSNGALPGAPAGGIKRRYDDAETGPAGPVGPDQKRHAGAAYGGSGGPETVLRLLVAAKRVGSVIGKGGSIVKQIREQTGCRIRVVDGIPTCDERVVIISAPEEGPEVEHGAAQKGLYEVHRLATDGDDPMPSGSEKSGHGLTRLLVCHSQAGSIIGKGGLIIKQMREQSGALIKVMAPEELPPCALSNDRVVQLMGEPAALQIALTLVSKQIRENPPKERPGGPPQTLSILTRGMMPAGPAQLNSAGGISSMRPGGGGGGGGFQSKKLMEVPQASIGSIIGSAGTNINRIRQETGAKIKVFDDPAADGQRTVEIAGTPEQIAAAEAAILPYATGDANAFY